MDAIDQKFVEHLQREYAMEMQALFAANDDLALRLQTGAVEASYDAGLDWFLITIDGQQEAVSYSIDNTLYLRAHPESNKIIGVELEHFSQHLSEHSRFLEFVFGLLGIAKIRSVRLVPTAPDQDREIDLVRDLRTLAAV